MTRTVQDAEVTHGALERWYLEWLKGRSKNDIERRELSDPYSHGKRITRLWREVLGTETEETHPMRTEIMRLRALLEMHGIDPDGES
jgi:hypothetical protein